MRCFLHIIQSTFNFDFFASFKKLLSIFNFYILVLNIVCFNKTFLKVFRSSRCLEKSNLGSELDTLHREKPYIIIMTDT